VALDPAAAWADPPPADGTLLAAASWAAHFVGVEDSEAPIILVIEKTRNQVSQQLWVGQCARCLGTCLAARPSPDLAPSTHS